MAVVATGFFDGVHLGHRLIIDTLLEQACKRREQSVVVTFWPHPRLVLGKETDKLKLLNSLEEKRTRLLSLGVDRVEVLDFDRRFSALTACQYLREYVKARMGGTAIVVGYDNRLGSDQQSDERLAEIAARLGLDSIYVGKSQDFSEAAISSTRIREALSCGDIAGANSMLGYSYGLDCEQDGCIPHMLHPVDSHKIIPAQGKYNIALDGASGRVLCRLEVSNCLQLRQNVDLSRLDKRCRISFLSE